MRHPRWQLPAQAALASASPAGRRLLTVPMVVGGLKSRPSPLARGGPGAILPVHYAAMPGPGHERAMLLKGSLGTAGGS